VRILSFDTSSHEIHVAVLEDAQVLAQTVIGDTEGNTRQEAVAALMPTIVSLLGRAHCQRQEIDCLVVGQGPGSFTGIRTAIVTARTLAQAMQLPLIAIPLFESYASGCELPAAVILNAGRGRYFACPFRGLGLSDFESSMPAFSGTACEVSAYLVDVLRWYCDCAVADGFAGSAKNVCPLPVVENIATKQAQIAWNRLCLNGNQATSPGVKAKTRESLLLRFPYDAVTPLYLRNPSITLKKSDGN